MEPGIFHTDRRWKNKKGGRVGWGEMQDPWANQSKWQVGKAVIINNNNNNLLHLIQQGCH